MLIFAPGWFSIKTRFIEPCESVQDMKGIICNHWLALKLPSLSSKWFVGQTGINDWIGSHHSIVLGVEFWLAHDCNVRFFLF